MNPHCVERRGIAAWTRPARIAMLAMSVMLVPGCSRNKAAAEDDEFLRIDPIPVHVKNENFADVNVAVVAGGISRRLGQVTGNASADFQVPWSVANGQLIYFTATTIGGRGGVTSAGLSLRPGQAVEFRVGSVLRQSVAVIREP